MRGGLMIGLGVVLACLAAVLAWAVIARPDARAIAVAPGAEATPGTTEAVPLADEPVLAPDGSVTRLTLTPSDQPATSQRIGWSSKVPGEQQVSIQAATGGEVTTWPARRLPAIPGVAGPPRFDVTITGLRPATTYTYRVGPARGWTPERTFVTADAMMPAAGWSFVALGDTQVENATMVRTIIAQAAEAVPDAPVVVQVGDVVNQPDDDAEWRDMFVGMGSTAGTRNWLVSIGNHEQCILIECEAHDAAAFRTYFRWPDNGFTDQGETWFLVDYQGVRFVVLDSFGGELAAQAEFLDEALGTNPYDWSVVVAHAPFFANRPERSNPDVRDLWLPILERHDVDLVLTGHDHSYARGQLGADGDGPVYVVSVSGPKFYPTSQRDWTRHGATRLVSAADTPTYQVVSVDDRGLTYRAIVAGTGEGLPSGRSVGDSLDEFTIVRHPDGSKELLSGVSRS